MGIYLPNMEMPTSEEKCKFFQPAPFRAPFCVINGVCHGIDYCPLVPVPPHGRLGDLDALYEKFSRLESEAMNALKTTTTGSVNWIKWSAILTERTGYKYDIADAPTIIPAEEE